MSAAPLTQNVELSELSADSALVRQIQTWLKTLGYYDDVVDGVVGKNTNHAFASWKADHWLEFPTIIGPGSYSQLKEQASKSQTTIDWANFGSRISRHFTVGEVARRERQRIPTDPTHRANCIRLAQELDKVRDWWGGPLGVTSWYRPPAVERRVGGSFHSHPFGLAADIYPISGSVREMQRRFQAEWYNTNRWQGGFGRGAQRGFIHLDLRARRDWNY